MSETLSEEAWSAVLELFAIAVLSDRSVKPEEIDEFCTQAFAIHQRFRPMKSLKRTTIIDWFAENRPRIESSLHAFKDHDYLRTIAGKIQPDNIRAQVLGGIFSLSVADHELHSEETTVLSQVMSVWGISQLPAQKT